MDSGAAVVVGRGAALFVLLVVLPLAITHGTHKTRELEDAWRKLAERHHLRYERRSRYKLPSISGELDGRALHIKGESRKDTAPVCVQLTLHGPLPEGLHIGPHEARVEVLGHVVVSGGINTGHSAFDEEVSVKTDNPEEIREYLTDDRKRAASRVVELGGELGDDALIVYLKRNQIGLESFDRLLRDLEETAAVLEVA